MRSIEQITRPKIVEAYVDLGDGDGFTIRFDRNRVTPVWARDADARAREGADPLAAASSLAEVIVEWDLTHEDGSPFPPTGENIGLLPFSAHRVLVESLVDASAPSRAEGNVSSGHTSTPPSGSTEQPQTPLNGPLTSPSPASSESPSPT